MLLLLGQLLQLAVLLVAVLFNLHFALLSPVLHFYHYGLPVLVLFLF